MAEIDFKIVIPARYSSSRFPGKPLADILGHPMIWHVHQRALESGANEIVIATDDEIVESAAREFGADVTMTSCNCESGTDRVAEVCEKRDWDPDTIVVNLQGDEPLTPPSVIEQVAKNLRENPLSSLATLSSGITFFDDFHDPNIVKVVSNQDGYAMYFSRAPIPWPRDTIEEVPAGACRHIGIYAYRAEFLKKWPRLLPSSLESNEKLEQLRAMDNGAQIHVEDAKEVPPHGVDTPEQLQQIVRIMKDRLK